MKSDRQNKFRAGSFIYETIPPAEELKDFVSCYWSVKSTGKSISRSLNHTPDDCMDVVFDFRTAQMRFDGLMLNSKTANYTGQVELMGVKLRPGAFFSLFHHPVHFFTDRTEPLEFIAARQALRLEEVFSAKTPETRIKIIESNLKKMAERLTPVNAKVSMALENIYNCKNLTKINKLTREVGLSWKWFEKEFEKWVGTTPKSFCGLLRFFNALNAVDTLPGKSISAIALENGYCDQAHFIREFKKHTGGTPLERRKRGLRIALAAC